MEFKGKQRAEEYVKNEFFNSSENKNIDQCFKNFAKGGFLDGYNQALKDSKSKEMLEILQRIENILTYDTIEPNSPLQEEIYNLIKQATEL